MATVIDLTLDANDEGAISNPIYVGAGEMLHTFVTEHKADAWTTAVLELVYAIGELNELGLALQAPAEGSDRWQLLTSSVELSDEGDVFDALAALGFGAVWAAWRVKTPESSDLQLRTVMVTAASTGRASA